MAIQSSLREKCGVVGIWTSDSYASYFARRALAALQHRGQESAGLSVLQTTGKITTFKGMGLVPHVLTEDVLKKLGKGHFSIGQNRYATFGRSSTGNAQPINATNGKYKISLGHNGNISDVANLKKQLGLGKKVIGDTQLMAQILVRARSKFDNWEAALIKTLPQFHGAYCLVMLTGDGSFFGIRDPYGIRPLCLGQWNGGWIIASESAAFDTIGADFIRDVIPGEIIQIDKKGLLTSSFFGEPKRAQHCLFECIYFARPDSFINGKRVRAGREESGRLLGERIKSKQLNPEVVVPTFDSGYPAAKGVAKSLDLPIVDAITTSHYVGRTFIQPGQNNRISAVNGKHNIVTDEIYGKRVVIVDDSAVRLTTSTTLTKKFREAGAKAIYLAFASPPVVNQCDLGIDMRTKKELPAAKFEKKPFAVIEQKVAEYVGADAVMYLPVDETTKAFDGTPKDFYHTPFGGPHPIRGKQEVFRKRKKNRTEKHKLLIFISGNGTYVQDIIEGIEKHTINAEIVGIVSNRKDAPGLARAEQYHIPTAIIPYNSRKDVELINHVRLIKPDLILLSGWQVILGDTFLNAMVHDEIPVYNQHPALLSSRNNQLIATSRGSFPILRGAHVQQVAFDKHYPVSGVSLHQVLAGNTFDVGPVILKSEVRIRPDDSYESVKHRMEDAEHLLVPTAIKRILHVLDHNIDISKGDFPW